MSSKQGTILCSTSTVKRKFRRSFASTTFNSVIAKFWPMQFLKQKNRLCLSSRLFSPHFLKLRRADYCDSFSTKTLFPDALPDQQQQRFYRVSSSRPYVYKSESFTIIRQLLHMNNVVVDYPTPSEGWGHGGRPWSPRSRATPQGLDQRS